MAIDRGTIDQQLQALGEGTRWWELRELRDLPAVLEADERILAISRGKIARVRWMRRSWLIVVTDRRLLCLRSGRGDTWRQLEVRAAVIERVSLRVGPFRGRVVISAGEARYRLLVPRTEAYRLVTALTSMGSPRRDTLTTIGPTLLVRRVIDHVLSLPAAALGPGAPRQVVPVQPDTSVFDQRVQLLEEQVSELQKQVEFLEELLRRRHAMAATEEYHTD